MPFAFRSALRDGRSAFHSSARRASSTVPSVVPFPKANAVAEITFFSLSHTILNENIKGNRYGASGCEAGKKSSVCIFCFASFQFCPRRPAPQRTRNCFSFRLKNPRCDGGEAVEAFLCVCWRGARSPKGEKESIFRRSRPRRGASHVSKCFALQKPKIANLRPRDGPRFAASASECERSSVKNNKRNVNFRRCSLVFLFSVRRETGGKNRIDNEVNKG